MKMTKVSYWKVTDPFKIGECVTVMGRDYVLERDRIRLTHSLNLRGSSHIPFGENSSSRLPARFHVASGDRSWAFRMRCLSLAKTCSIGLRSGL